MIGNMNFSLSVRQLATMMEPYLTTGGHGDVVTPIAETIGSIACFLSLVAREASGKVHRMGYVKRRGTTSAKVPVVEFERIKEEFLTRMLYLEELIA